MQGKLDPGSATRNFSPAVTTSHDARARDTSADAVSAARATVTVEIVVPTADFDDGGADSSDMPTSISTLLSQGGPLDCIGDMNADGFVNGHDRKLFETAPLP